MASKIALMRSLQEKSLRAEQTLVCLKQQFEQLKKLAVTSACAQQEESYKAENEKLRNEVTQLRTKLIEVETKNGLKQVPLPENLKSSQTLATSTEEPVAQDKPLEKQQANKVEKQQTNKVEKQANKVEKQQANKAEKQQANKVEKQQANKVEKQQANKVEKQQGEKEEKATKKEDKNIKKQANQAQPQKAEKSDNKGSSEQPPDVSKLNMKIGKIVAVEKHPDADSLYVEQVDLGEGKNRTIISGLVKHVPIEQMQGRLAVFLTNLKPAKMRGIMSEGMIMCANVPEKVEIIEPPPGAAIGDRVIVEGYPGEPDEMLNPKKKTWESIMPDLQANEVGLATYKGALWKIEGKGYFKAPTVRSGQIK